MKIGCARVSTQEQELDLQIDALETNRCAEIYREKITGATRERPQFRALLDHLREDDVVVIWKLDRQARSLKDLVEIVNEMQEKGAELQSLQDQIDTTTPHGRLTFHVFAALSLSRTIDSRRIRPGLGSFSHPTALRTIRGLEAMHMIRKGQIRGADKGYITAQNQFIAGLFGLAI